MYDPLMLKRVKQYLEENVDKTHVDVPEMTKYLQTRYPEYARRKHQPLRQLVDQAYRIVSDQLMHGQPSSGDESELSDLEVMADSSSNNIMNNLMSSLYAKPKPTNSGKPTTTTTAAAAAAVAAAVAIDISSDEEESCDGNYPNGRSQAEKANSEAFGELVSGDVTVKVVGGPSSASSSTGAVATADSNLQPGQKRHDNTSEMVQANKKRKLNKTGKESTQFSNGKNMRLLNKRFINLGKEDALHQPKSNGAGTNVMLGLPPLTAANTGHSTINQMNNPMNSINPNIPIQQQPVPQHLDQNLFNRAKPRKYKKEIHLRKSNETFRDIGGMEAALKELCELLMHVKSPDAYYALGLMPPRGILLHGPSGCGKTLLAHAIAGQLDLPLCEVPATELIAGISGESEQRIRDIFEQAAACAPCLLFLDEIDAISSNRSMAQRDMERRVVSQLISSLDDLRRSSPGQSVLVIGATTRPDVLDPGLRRVGRFDHEITIGVPSRKDRKQILEVLCEGIAIDPKCDYDKIAELTPGYVGADILALISRAATLAVKRKCSQQLHAFQMNALTIVDLDADDAENDTMKNDAQAEEQMEVDECMDKESTEAVATEVPDDIADTSVKTSKPDDAAPEDDDNTATTITTSTPTTENDNDDNAKTETVDVSTTSSKPEDADELSPKGSTKDRKSATPTQDTAATSTMQTTADPLELDATEHVRQPTLFEMLNWLDNPPDDPQFLENFSITFEDICEAIKVVQPSAKREGFITVPDTTWDDIGSLQDIREELKLAVLAPVKYPEMLQRLGITAPSGVLLCGPPGCGKTLLAKAIANEAGINFISVKGPELMNMYVGESERSVRACFQRARNSAPCVIFFDEFDSLCPKRSDGNESGSGVRIVNQLLTEMDGVEERKGVYILAATNRPDIIDPAILRPGRLDTILYVGLPQEQDRIEILKATTKNATRPVLSGDVDFAVLAKQTEGYTGADLAGLVKQASMLALKEALNNPDAKLEDLCVGTKHFDGAINMLRPSISDQDRVMYEKLRMKYAARRSQELLQN